MVHSLLHNSIPFEQSAFFMLHCLATILQVVFTGLISDSVSMIDQILGIDLNKFYVEWKLVKMTAIVGRILTWMFFVWTGGLFFGGLEREGLFWRMIEPVYIPNVIEGIY